ncbi:hypothetical protein DL764_000181 [Monosporascus ibericus]|uniref:Metallo-beta-lactamase domain-containing protein n=1 Tax=Monosporascus ibericus TaxID=155417 RepID=A0A4Q4TUJ6_9PEZI|nr:hypothetical protein DL764_000181 [Monosporascus ibericus]
MSSFMGIVREFPEIRFDYFCELDQRPPLACFLSHVHSDHLRGLDTLKSPLEILLRLGKLPSRLNYARGITEKHNPTYKELEKIVKPLPLETPVVLKLKPGFQIQVTLLDANHCVGAVMFLVEGDGKAVLYTGDIRSEPWWVNAISRNPCILEYSSGLRSLDCIYLDTSVLDDFHIQTKAEGLRELLEKVAQYPDDTIFHFQARTYGYEEVWIAFAKALASKIHVDDYKLRIYKSLISGTKSTDDRFPVHMHLAKEAPYLVGFTRGNSQQEGCLTRNEGVRIHSCEKGTGCSVMANIRNKPVVWIKPIVAHLKDGQDVVEVGIGGGGDDLVEKSDQQDLTPGEIKQLIKTNVPKLLQVSFASFLLNGAEEPRGADPDFTASVQSIPVNVVDVLRSLSRADKDLPGILDEPAVKKLPNGLPNRIVFPYARHSSLPELRHLVQTFKPKDAWPCTFNFLSWERRRITIRNLFGDCCSGDTFAHDILTESMRESLGRDGGDSNEPNDTQRTLSSLPAASSPVQIPTESSDSEGSVANGKTGDVTPYGTHQVPVEEEVPQPEQTLAKEKSPHAPRRPTKRSYEEFYEDTEDPLSADEPDLQDDSQASVLSAHAQETRLNAFRAAEAMMKGGEWRPIELISTTHHHTLPEKELGGP